MGSIMKRFFRVFFFGIAATTLFACNKETDIQTPDTSGVRKVEFVAGPVTRTVFGTPDGTSLPTLWTTNKKVGISLNFADAKQSTEPIVSNDGTSASFSVDIENGEGVSAPYVFYAVSPSTALISMSSTHKSTQVDISASQTPLDNSVDEGAQVLVAKYDAGNTFPTSSITMDFAHLTAYGKMSFSNLSLANGETVASVALTAAENWVGRYYYYFEDNGTNDAGDLVENSASKTLTLTTNKTTDIWFACAPVDLGGKKVNVVITTNTGTTYSKEITIPAGKTFSSGKVNSFKVNMNGITADGAVEYELVTNPADLTVGSKVIIAAPGSTASAMSTTQNGNNRGSTSVTKSNNNTVITSPSDAVQILTVTPGNKDNTIGFSTGGGYLYAASSDSNWLRTEETLSDESSWTVTIDSDGVATVTAQGTNTRNILRYNGTNNPPIFSCYASGSSVQTKVSIYKLPDNIVWTLSSIAVTTAPDKTAYEAGESFDPTGMVVTATYVDADDSQHTKTVVLNNSDLTISPSTNLEAGTTSVSISYGGKSTTQAITVTATPKINVTSTNPMEVANTASNQTITYTIDNPVAGKSLSASTEASWITNLNYATTGQVTFSVSAQDPGVGMREGIITLTYDGAEDVAVTVKQAAGEGYSITYAYSFTSKDWEATLDGETADWSSGAPGYGFESRGVQVTQAKSGANATSPVSFSGISNITVSLARTSKGVGSVAIMVGNQTVATQESFNETVTDYSFDISNLSGVVKIVVNCTTNSIYVKGISITAASIGGEGGSGEGTEVTFTVGVDSSDGKTLEKEGVTLSTTSGVWNRTDEYRIYSGATLTVSVPSGNNITGIVFTYAQNKFSTTTGALTDEGVWSGTANSIKFNAADGQVRVKKIVVTYN